MIGTKSIVPGSTIGAKGTVPVYLNGTKSIVPCSTIGAKGTVPG